MAARPAAQADDGYLYPLERAFFYVHKPPTLLVHDEIESVEFCRQGGGVLAASAKTFDLAIRTRNDQARPAALKFTSLPSFEVLVQLLSCT